MLTSYEMKELDGKLDNILRIWVARSLLYINIICVLLIYTTVETFYKLMKNICTCSHTHICIHIHMHIYTHYTFCTYILVLYILIAY